MGQFKSTLIKALWVAAVGFALYRTLTGPNLSLSAVEGLMVLIAAFVAHKTLDLLLPTQSAEDD